MACIDCKFAVESPQIKRFYCMNNERNKNTDREERYKRTQGIDCPYCTSKERGGGEVMTEKQKALIDDMNEFCTEKLNYDENTTKAEAREYISRNIEQFKLLTMDNWQIQYL